MDKVVGSLDLILLKDVDCMLMGRVLGKVMDWLLVVVGIMDMLCLVFNGKVGFFMAMGCLLESLSMYRRRLVGFVATELEEFMDMVLGYFMACFTDWLKLELSILLWFKWHDDFKV